MPPHGSADLTTSLDRLIRPGARVAMADGCGAPRSLLPALNEVARRRGDLRLVLGWLPVAEPDLQPDLFADVRAFMSGWGLRTQIDDGRVVAVRCRLSAVPALLAGPLAPDLLLAGLVRRGSDYFLGAESAWMRGLICAGVPVAAVVARRAPAAEAGPPLPMGAVTVLAEVDDLPHELRVGEPGATELAIAAHAARLVPADCRVQLAAGKLGAALLDAIEVPVAVDSGLLPNAVIRLERRGLLRGTPIATYLAGTAELHDWADGRGVLHPIETTHDPGRLSNGIPLLALNTAVEIDLDGQVNAEGTPASIVGGIGGHPDYTAAAARSRHGLSVIALPSHHDGRSTLVRTLARPVTTPAHDVDVVVNEWGAADLRGRSREERALALRTLWQGRVSEALES